MSDPVEEKYPNPPADMAELLRRIATEWQTFRDYVLALPEERLTAAGKDGWSVKDHVAHLTFWEQVLVRSYLGDEPQHVVMGLPAEEAARLDTEDAVNDWIFRRHRDRPASEVLADAWRLHDEAVAEIGRYPFALLARPYEPGSSYPLYAFVIGNTYGHYMEHLPWLRELVAGIKE